MPNESIHIIVLLYHSNAKIEYTKNEPGQMGEIGFKVAETYPKSSSSKKLVID